MEHLEAVKAISFDAVGTLFHLRRPVGEVYAEVARTENLKIDPQAATRAFREILPTLRTREDGVRPDDDRGFWKTIVATVLERCSGAVDATVAERIFEKAYEQYRGAAEWALFPETLDVLESLQKRWPLVVTSNYDGRLHGTLAALGLRDFFCAAIVSSEVGSEKPAPGIYRKTAETLMLPPEDIVHVGDEREGDFAGAQNAGLQAWLVERPQTTLQTLRDRLQSTANS